MSAERHETVSRIVAEAARRAPAERAAYLDDACAGDDGLRREVESLLDFHDRPGLEPGANLGSILDDAAAPERIGDFTITGVLGAGGMGIVYRARQGRPARDVALKVLRFGGLDPRARRRFEYETEILAGLEHPGIARLYEGGTDDAGRPWFAMELVEGRPLTAYADAAPLDRRARLALMADVCDAVHHAHLRGVTHRDLKPANILVDDAGRPKVLDFGVARAADGDPRVTARTRSGEIIGTLPYMSPEQLGGTGAVDVRADVYALGVIGFELLTGRLPHDVRDRPLVEAIDALRGAEAPRLGTLDRGLRGDVETIVGTALDRDPDRRYASAGALADDLRHHLDDRPIVARPPSTVYQLSKFARRHRALAAATLAVAGTLVAATAVASTFAVTARRQSAVAEAVAAFLHDDLLAAVAPSVEPGRGRDVAMRDVLDEAAQRLDDAAAPGGRFAERPVVEAALRHVIAQTYHRLGLYDEAERQSRRALALREAALGAAAPDTLESRAALALALREQGRLDDAAPHYRAVIEERVGRLGLDHADTRRAMNELGNLYADQGRYDDAEALYGRAIEGWRRAAGDDDPGTLHARHNLALLRHDQARYDDAEIIARDVLDRRTHVLGPEHPDTLRSIACLVIIERAQGRYADAEARCRALLDVRRRVMGPEHSDTIGSMINLAVLCRAQERDDEARTLYEDVIAISTRTLGPEHPDTLMARHNLANVYAGLDRLPEAEAIYRDLLAVRRRDLGDEHPVTLSTLNNLAVLCRMQAKYDEAEPLLVEVIALRERTLGPDHDATLNARHNLGRLYTKQARFDDAATLHRAVLAARERTLGPAHPDTRTSMEALVELYDAWSRPDVAAEWRRAIDASRVDAGGDPP